uniref:Uncharacterized protein n=1 Tax=Romanomermis culicivorax TaxID=13658 RepID=A0A915K7J3_ROMCU
KKIPKPVVWSFIGVYSVNKVLEFNFKKSKSSENESFNFATVQFQIFDDNAFVSSNIHIQACIISCRMCPSKTQWSPGRLPGLANAESACKYEWRIVPKRWMQISDILA